MTSHTPLFARRGFTLAEVMVSIALALLLMIGVNQIFSTTSQTVSTGFATSEAIRAHRGIGTSLAADINGYGIGTGIAPAAEQPCIIISSARVAAFNDASDQQRAFNPSNPMIADDGSTTFSTTTYNYRNHRVDRLSFFVKGTFPRQTANDGRFISNLIGNEAWIWYGHLKIANNNSTAIYYDPGQADIAAGSNINNNHKFASQFVLGRVAMVMRDPAAADKTIRDSLNAPQYYIGRSAAAVAGNMAPFSHTADSTLNASSFGTPELIKSRYDLAGITMADYLTVVSDAETAGGTWWDQMMAGWNFPQVMGGGIGNNADNRFWCNPFPTKTAGTGVNSEAVARTHPFLAAGVTQFIVEYAGDFNADSAIDTDIDGTITRIRWYGFPRDLDGDGNATAPAGDVVPARDHGLSPAFEKLENFPGVGNYTNMPANARYTAVFGRAQLGAATPVQPWLIRIIVTTTDPNGRLIDGLTQEYIYNVKK